MLRSRVRDLSEKLVSNARFVYVDKTRINEVAEAMKDFEFVLPTWDSPLFYLQSDDFEEMCKFYLIFNSINYCYFNYGSDRFEDFPDEKRIAGSNLVTLRLTENWDELKDPTFLTRVDENYLLSELFTASRPISLVKERVKALREIGKFLNENMEHEDLFFKVFCRYRQDAYITSQAIPTFLPTWSDPFYKRAQFFVSQVCGRFQNRDDLPIKKESLDNITVFADYRLPQTLIGMGIIRGSGRLLSRLAKNKEIESGSCKELELRAATVVAGDLLVDALNKDREGKLTTLHISHMLWSCGRGSLDLSKDIMVSPMPNHHRTFTTDY